MPNSLAPPRAHDDRAYYEDAVLDTHSHGDAALDHYKRMCASLRVERRILREGCGCDDAAQTVSSYGSA